MPVEERSVLELLLFADVSRLVQCDLPFRPICSIPSIVLSEEALVLIPQLDRTFATLLASFIPRGQGHPAAENDL